jgi:hypothetical protein
MKYKVSKAVEGHSHAKLGVLRTGAVVEWQKEWGPVPGWLEPIKETSKPGSKGAETEEK